MAEDLEEIVPMPDDLGPSMAGVRRDAQWSHQFAPSDTSLAQRARGNQDKMLYAAQLQDQRRQVEMEKLKTNKVAQDLYFRNQKLAMEKTAAQAALAERAQRMKYQAERMPLVLEAQKAKMKADLAAEDRRLKEQAIRDATKADADLLIAERLDFKLKNPGIAPEKMEDFDVSLGDKYPRAWDDDDAKAFLIPAKRNSMMRQTVNRRAEAELAERAAVKEAATAGGFEQVGIGASGNPIYRKPDDRPEKFGTVSEKISEGVTVSRPARANEADLLRHNKLEAEINAKSGKGQDAAKVAELNSLKAKLGYQPIGGAAPASAGGAPTTAQQPASPAAGSLPTLTSKTEFDALPSGAEYMRDGRKYRKP